MYNCLNCKKEIPYRGVQYSHKYCNNKCQADYQSNEKIRAWIYEGKDWKGNIPQWAKRHLSELSGYKCAECGISDYNGKEIVLDCDHKDGNSENNSVENLRLLCPNCHSQTSTYKNKNIGNGRQHRRKEI